VLNLGQGDQKAADYLKINPTAHPDLDRSRGSGRKAPDRDPVLGDPDVSL
jgi:hypothetical protein